MMDNLPFKIFFFTSLFIADVIIISLLSLHDTGRIYKLRTIYF